MANVDAAFGFIPIRHLSGFAPRANKYTITAKSFNSDTITNALYTNIAATSSDSGNGGSSVVGAYQINTGASSANPLVGWGASGWGSGAWGEGISDTETLRIWSQQNFGEDLIFGHRDGAIFYWDASGTLTTRAVLLSSKAGASGVPTVQNSILVSDISRFVFCFGTNVIGSATKDPMLIRWSDQEDATNWTPAATNQAGSLRLSRGTGIPSTTRGSCLDRLISIFFAVCRYRLRCMECNACWGTNLDNFAK